MQGFTSPLGPSSMAPPPAPFPSEMSWPHVSPLVPTLSSGVLWHFGLWAAFLLLKAGSLLTARLRAWSTFESPRLRPPLVPSMAGGRRCGFDFHSAAPQVGTPRQTMYQPVLPSSQGLSFLICTHGWSSLRSEGPRETVVTQALSKRKTASRCR